MGGAEERASARASSPAPRRASSSLQNAPMDHPACEMARVWSAPSRPLPSVWTEAQATAGRHCDNPLPSARGATRGRDVPRWLQSSPSRSQPPRPSFRTRQRLDDGHRVPARRVEPQPRKGTAQARRPSRAGRRARWLRLRAGPGRQAGSTRVRLRRPSRRPWRGQRAAEDGLRSDERRAHRRREHHLRPLAERSDQRSHHRGNRMARASGRSTLRTHEILTEHSAQLRPPRPWPVLWPRALPRSPARSGS